jgi:hypothetical protein
MCVALRMRVEKINIYKDLVGKDGANRALTKRMRSWEGVVWINLAHDKDK